MSEEDSEDKGSDSQTGADKTKSLGAQLSEVATAIDFSNSLTAAIRTAIDDLLHKATVAVDSAVASVLIRDGDEGGLRFLTATSGVTEELLALRLPPGAGIAGLVFSTTQPMAVADVAKEGSFWSEADRRTGFKTVTLLATPLRADHELVGVLEFVNRPGEPPYPPFTPAEMDRGARFAEPIARLVDAYEIAQQVESLFTFSVRSALTLSSPAQRQEAQREWLADVQSPVEHREMLALWLTLRDVANQGHAERKLCLELLESIERFTESKAGGLGQFGF
jgi:hypothetical protein